MLLGMGNSGLSSEPNNTVIFRVFMPPIIKCRGHYVMANESVASVSVNILFPSIIGQTPGSIDPIFQWLIGGD
jgi:hypothetical protein